MTESKWDKKLRAIWDEMMKDPTVPAHDIMFDFARRAYDPRRTHPEAQGNKDLGEPAASGLEVKDLLKRLREPSGIGEPHDHALMREAAEMLAVTDYGYREVCKVNDELQALCSALQAALAAAPTSPQPIKGDKTEALTDAATVQALEVL